MMKQAMAMMEGMNEEELARMAAMMPGMGGAQVRCCGRAGAPRPAGNRSIGRHLPACPGFTHVPRRLAQLLPCSP
jgi:hypothetical protein